MKLIDSHPLAKDLNWSKDRNGCVVLAPGFESNAWGMIGMGAILLTVIIGVLLAFDLTLEPVGDIIALSGIGVAAVMCLMVGFVILNNDKKAIINPRDKTVTVSTTSFWKRSELRMQSPLADASLVILEGIQRTGNDTVAMGTHGAVAMGVLAMRINGQLWTVARCTDKARLVAFAEEIQAVSGLTVDLNPNKVPEDTAHKLADPQHWRSAGKEMKTPVDRRIR